ncbi:MAG: diacylglycerol kinase family protein [Chitinophagaceae bacterium]|nr:diacylglycerol kinase family protein [Chitinophagaceae bacterium]
MKFITSFKYAFNGIKLAICSERNFKIECTLGLLSILLSVLLKLNAIEWIAILLSNAIVLSLELINTAMEKICDFINPGIHPQIKNIKDISAGAVLVASIASMAIGFIIFFPKIIVLLKSIQL